MVALDYNLLDVARYFSPSQLFASIDVPTATGLLLSEDGLSTGLYSSIGWPVWPRNFFLHEVEEDQLRISWDHGKQGFVKRIADLDLVNSARKIRAAIK